MQRRQRWPSIAAKYPANLAPVIQYSIDVSRCPGLGAEVNGGSNNLKKLDQRDGGAKIMPRQGPTEFPPYLSMTD